jgi:hypothetical protein
VVSATIMDRQSVELPEMSVLLRSVRKGGAI